MKSLQELERRLKDLEKEIQEAEKRLPAHSTKPQTMMSVLALEDERDAILKQIQDLKIENAHSSTEADTRNS